MFHVKEAISYFYKEGGGIYVFYLSMAYYVAAQQSKEKDKVEDNLCKKKKKKTGGNLFSWVHFAADRKWFFWSCVTFYIFMVYMCSFAENKVTLFSD